ncbi:MAG: hypothetical protein Q7U04_14490 [Bacteriovorax sp.]|nr:hypothetical protein [Bacteriovorax sp.]
MACIRLIVLFISCAITQLALAQGLGKNTDIIQNIILETQLQNYLNNNGSSKFDAKVECYKVFQEAKAFWLKKSKSANRNLLVEGVMEEVFTKDEILNMGKTNIHGLKSKVRGTSKYIIGGYSHADAPGFPHMRPRCENIYKEEVVIKEIAGRSCREIKLTFDQKPDDFYYQVYCDNDSELKINFDVENDPLPLEINKSGKDCVHCR